VTTPGVTRQHTWPRISLLRPSRRRTGRPSTARAALYALLALCGALAVTACADDMPPGASGDYPDIAESPTERPEVAPASERAEIAEGLRADRREDRYEGDRGPRQRSSEVRPPEYTPPPETESPAPTPPAARLDAGEQPATAARPDPEPGQGESITRRDIPAPPGQERSAVAAGTPTPGPFVPEATPGRPLPAQTVPSGPPVLAGPAGPPLGTGFRGGPVVVDSRGVTTMGPGGPLTTPGPYPVAGAPVAASAHGPAFGPAVSAAPGAQPLSAYGTVGGARSQRVAVIYFADGSANLSGRDRHVLRQVAALQQHYGGVIRVVGHASSRTGAMDITRHKLANFTVSLGRANAVAGALMDAGVPGRFLYVGAVSDSQPVYYEIMPTGEAGNRRAEIYMDY